MDEENPSIPPLLSDNEVLSPVIDTGESKDRRDSPREIYRESFYKIFSDEKMSLFLSRVLSSMTYCSSRSFDHSFVHPVFRSYRRSWLDLG